MAQLTLKQMCNVDFRRVAVSGHRDEGDKLTLQDYALALFPAMRAKDYDALKRIMSAQMYQFAVQENCEDPSDGALRAYQYLDRITDYDLSALAHHDPLAAQALFQAMYTESGNIGLAKAGAELVREAAKIPQVLPEVVAQQQKRMAVKSPTLFVTRK